MSQFLNRTTSPLTIIPKSQFHVRRKAIIATSDVPDGHQEEEEEEAFYSTELQSCTYSTNVGLGRSIHATLHKKSYFSNPLFLQNHLLNMYFKCRDIASAHHLFDQMPARNVVTWSSAISGFVRCGRPQSALSSYVLMQRLRLRPNQFTLVAMLNACSSIQSNHSVADQVYGQVLRLGYGSNVFLLNAFLTATIRNGNLVGAVALFETFMEVRRDVVTWNSMLAGLLELSCSEVWMLWCRMIREGVRPDEFTFSTVLTGLARIEGGGGLGKNGLATHGQLVKCGHGDDMCVGDSLMDMYLSKQMLREGCKVFDQMATRDVISWTQMASGWFRSGQPSNALRQVNTMMQMGIRPNKFTLALNFNVAATLVCLEQGKKFHGVKIKLGRHEIDDCVDNALIDMYTKCGSMDAASKVFRSMEGDRRSVITWTTMIMGFAQNGLAEDALRMFERMLASSADHVQPNSITFICVLYACSQGGFVEQGWRYFSSMRCDHHIVPEEDHYACMVDLLGRAGHIADAEALIRSMPFRPRALVWQTLLGACRIHGDVETGERAAEKAIAQDGQDHSTYVLLSNMFATSRHWEGVGRVRKLLAERHVQRIHGRSWIEVGTQTPAHHVSHLAQQV